MIDLKNIHSLSEFQRNSKNFVRRLEKSGRPEVLTINGEAKLVVLSADAYQKLLDSVEEAENVASIHRGLLEAQRGEGVPLTDVIKKLRSRGGTRKSA